MKLDFVKHAGGVLIPASDEVVEKLEKFKTGEIYPVEIKRARNPHFHGKVFAFFNFCFEYWAANKTHWEHMSDPKQKESFRNQLTIHAGYFDTTYSIDGISFEIKAKSLRYGNMEQDEFEECYSALINAAIKHVFQNTTDEQIINKLMGFF